MRNVAPSLVTQLVSLLKDTSLGYIVAFTELLYRGQVLASYLHLLIPTYIVVTAIYLVVNGSLSFLASRLQTRLASAPGQAASPAGTSGDRSHESRECLSRPPHPSPPPPFRRWPSSPP